MKDQTKLLLAFEHGIRLASVQGPKNVMFAPTSIVSMSRRASHLNLSCPAEWIINDCDAAKMDVWMYQKRQDRIERGARGQALLTDAPADEEDEKSDDDEDVDFGIDGGVDDDEIVFECEET